LEQGLAQTQVPELASSWVALPAEAVVELEAPLPLRLVQPGAQTQEEVAAQFQVQEPVRARQQVRVQQLVPSLEAGLLGQVPEKAHSRVARHPLVALTEQEKAIRLEQEVEARSEPLLEREELQSQKVDRRILETERDPLRDERAFHRKLRLRPQ
jgi:hypothetical protein